MKKVYCDICKQEVTDVKEYVLSKREIIYAEDMNGNKLMSFWRNNKTKT